VVLRALTADSGERKSDTSPNFRSRAVHISALFASTRPPRIWHFSKIVAFSKRHRISRRALLSWIEGGLRPFRPFRGHNECARLSRPELISKSSAVHTR